MIKISINGKTMDREFPNMAHALVFAYQRGECYAAKVVEIAEEGSVSKDGTITADIDAACEKYCKEANEQLISQLEALRADLEAKDTEIAGLKAQLELMAADTESINGGGDGGSYGHGNGGTSEIVLETIEPITEIPLEEMNKEQLLSFALESNIDVNYTASKEDILAVIKEVLEKKIEEGNLVNTVKT